MEMGKDVIALAPDGTPCAYQLKGAPGRRITLNDWRDISQQAFDLVVGRIVHPSLASDAPHHRAYLVTNGLIDEEVARAIDDMNQGWQARGQDLKLYTIVRGELLTKAKRLFPTLWPSELSATRNLLELTLNTGSGTCPRSLAAGLMNDVLPLDLPPGSKAPTVPHCTRSVASAAVATAIAMNPFASKENFVAEAEGWTIYCSYVLALATKWDLPEAAWRAHFELATSHIYNLLTNLCEELSTRTTLIERSALTDRFVLRARRTWLVGLMSVLGLWRRYRGDSRGELDDYICRFCKENLNKLWLWGEDAMPLFLAAYWYVRTVDGSCRPDVFLQSLIDVLSRANHPDSKHAVPNPYHDVTDCLKRLNGLHRDQTADHFAGESYYLESLLHLYVRKNWKQRTKSLWPQITHVSFEEHVCDEPLHERSGSSL